MEIILKSDKERVQSECTFRFGKGLTQGKVSLVTDLSGTAVILVGGVNAEDEGFENSLLCGFKSALEIVKTRGSQTISIDVASFATEETFSYAMNAILDCLIELRCSAMGAAFKVYLVGDFRQMNEMLLQQAEISLFAPTKTNLNLSFGDGGDPLKEAFDGYLSAHSEQKSFREYLGTLIEEKKIAKYSEVYKRAGVSKSTFSKIMNFSIDYKPSKATVAALAIGLKLDLEEAIAFFHAAGYHLGTAEFADKVVRFFLERKIYDIQEVNCCLYYYGLPLLGEHGRDDNVRLK